MLKALLSTGIAVAGIICIVGLVFGFQKLSNLSSCDPGYTCIKSISARHNDDKSYPLPIICDIVGKNKEKLSEMESQNQEGHIPDFIGIGVRKCGTGVYMNFLRKHGSFSFPIWHNYETEYFTRRRNCGLEWYMHRFRSSDADKYFIEKTPHYFYAAPAAIPQDILELNPQMKAVLLLCDPTTRAFSCFVHHYIGEYIGIDANFATEEFQKYVLHEIPILHNIISRMNASEKEKYLLKIWESDQECLLAGLYSVHIIRWLRHFGSSQLLVLNGEDMMKNPGPEYLKLQNFLGVSQKFRLQDWEKHKTTGHFCLHPPVNRSTLFCQDDGRRKGRTRALGQNKAKPSEEAVKLLQQFYKPYNEQLYKILRKNFYWI